MTLQDIIPLVAALIGLCASIITGTLVYRAERAKVAAQASVGEASYEAEQAKLLNLQAEQLREGLLADNKRLADRVGRLEERTESLENENIRLRLDLAACLEERERPNDTRGHPIDRRRRYTSSDDEQRR